MVVRRLLFFIIIIISACGGGGSSSSSTSTTGTSPAIQSVSFYNQAQPYQFDVGQWVALDLTVLDPDLDAQTLYIAIYIPSDASRPTRSNTFALTTQTQNPMRYIDISSISAESAGSRKAEFIVRDAQGNESPVRTIFYTIL